tara:strand:- start:9636 stop:9929 length:294 start_codon:yes stop_codon:yes gene_type:complete
MQKPDQTKQNGGGKTSLPEPDSAHERNKAAPESADLVDASEVLKDAETTPSGGTPRRSGGDRVADAGDLGRATPSLYSQEAQADAVARQTKRPKSED